MGENLNMHEEVVAEPVEEMAAPALDTGEEPVAQNKAKGDKAGAWIKSLFSTKKRKIIAVVLLVVIVLGGAAAGVFSYFSPSSTAERFCKASYCDARTFFSMTAYDTQSALLHSYDGDEEAFFEAKSDALEADIASWDDYYKALDTTEEENLTDKYGRYKITVETTRARDVSVRKLEEDYGKWLEQLESQGLFDRDSIQAVKEVTVKAKLTGEDETARKTFEVYLVKVGFQWKVITYDD